MAKVLKWPFSADADPRLDPKRVAPSGEIIYNGKRRVRVYWNIGNAAPYRWSFDLGDARTEVYVRDIESEVPLHSAFSGSEAKWPNPAGWFEGEGYIQIHDGKLRLLKDPPVPKHCAA